MPSRAPSMAPVISRTDSAISLELLLDASASFLTSSTTTANPFPASPAVGSLYGGIDGQKVGLGCDVPDDPAHFLYPSGHFHHRSIFLNPDSMISLPSFEIRTSSSTCDLCSPAKGAIEPTVGSRAWISGLRVTTPLVIARLSY